MYQNFLILIASIIFTASAQLCLKKGMLSLGTIDISANSFLGLIPRIFQSVWLTGGLFLYGASFLLWLVVISRIKLSLAYPIAASLNFSLIVIFSWLFFREQLVFVQILGIAFIVFGIFLLLKP